MTDDYSDIINLPHHTSKNRKHMSVYERAAQFAPFAALNGHSDAINETARITEEKEVLDEEKIALINNKLNFLKQHLENNIEITITYFINDIYKSGGKYVEKVGIIKKFKEDTNEIILLDLTIIPINDIYEIDGNVFLKENWEEL